MTSVPRGSTSVAARIRHSAVIGTHAAMTLPSKMLGSEPVSTDTSMEVSRPQPPTREARDQHQRYRTDRRG